MNDELPRVSVIVPTYQRHDQLRTLLRGLERLDYPADRYEVIVVDDGSEPPVAQTADAGDFAMDLRIMRQENSGPARARNTGASHATGDLLAFTDDDCVPEPDWLRVLAAAHRRNPAAVIGGEAVNDLPDNPCATASQLLVDYLYAYYHDGSGKPGAFFTSNNLAVPRNAWEASGGFDESFPRAAAEDREFCERLARAGHRLVLERAARVNHAHAMTLRGFWRQHFNYGSGARHLHQRRAGAGGAPTGREPWSFYRGLLCHPLGGRGDLRHVALILVSQLANAAGYWSGRAGGTR